MRVTRVLAALFPFLTTLRLEQIVLSDQHLTLTLQPMRATARCPTCHQRSRRVHSRYVRTVADLPCTQYGVRVDVQARRFRCLHPTCARQTFREPFPELVPVYGRRTPRLRARLEQLGVALGGRPASRLAGRQAITDGASRTTFLRLVRALPTPATSPPRVLGVDDWAQRRGRTYGTILVDLEARRPVDLLPERSATSFAEWLRAHPAPEIIARDRGGVYADGARQAAPAAVQVADRFHLAKNLGEQLEALVLRHHGLLREVAQEVDKAASPPAADPAATATGAAAATAGAHGEAKAATPMLGPMPPGRTRRDLQLQQERHVRRLGRYEQAQALHAQGHSIRHIAHTLGLARGTVRRFVHAEAFPERQPRACRPGQLAVYDAYLRMRWEAGEHNAAHLWRELRARGFHGGAGAVRRYLTHWRPGPRLVGRRGRRDEAGLTAPPRPPFAPSPRQTRWLLLREAHQRAQAALGEAASQRGRRSRRMGLDEPLDGQECRYVEGLRDRSAAIRTTQDLVQSFRLLLRAGDSAGLDRWLQAATDSELPELLSFVNGVRRDRAAVEAALACRWSSGQVEGQINRLKTIKRQMYGRAKPDLLRQRVLHAA